MMQSRKVKEAFFFPETNSQIMQLLLLLFLKKGVVLTPEYSHSLLVVKL